MSRLARPAGLRLAWAAVTVAVTAALGGCFTGERPVLTPAPATTGDAAADAVLQRLQNAATATFTANYQIVTPIGEEAPAVVVQDGETRRSVTIANARFLTDGTTTLTCRVDDGTCEQSIDGARVSNLAVTPDFYDVSPAARLRRDVQQRVGATEATSETIAGQAATCVTIPIADTAARYCALDAGPLAALQTTDVMIELTDFTTEIDPAQFPTPAG